MDGSPRFVLQGYKVMTSLGTDLSTLAQAIAAQRYCLNPPSGPQQAASMATKSRVISALSHCVEADVRGRLFYLIKQTLQPLLQQYQGQRIHLHHFLPRAIAAVPVIDIALLEQLLALAGIALEDPRLSRSYSSADDIVHWEQQLDPLAKGHYDILIIGATDSLIHYSEAIYRRASALPMEAPVTLGEAACYLALAAAHPSAVRHYSLSSQTGDCRDLPPIETVIVPGCQLPRQAAAWHRLTQRWWLRYQRSLPATIDWTWQLGDIGSVTWPLVLLFAYWQLEHAVMQRALGLAWFIQQQYQWRTLVVHQPISEDKQ